MVSIPIGFSSSLQRSPGLRERSGDQGFNPYRVFKFVATYTHVVTVCGHPARFNPYRVFKFVATSTETYDHIRDLVVSIPIGFSSSLQQTRTTHSIAKLLEVSIPIGFSSSLQPVWRGQQAGRRGVSIPIGFSSSLQQYSVPATEESICSFNPYRVFKFVATARVRLFINVPAVVSIPIGFSSSLQLPRQGGVYNSKISFNPYRVFKFVATAPFEWLFLAIILSKSQKLRPPGMNLFRTRPL